MSALAAESTGIEALPDPLKESLNMTTEPSAKQGVTATSVVRADGRRAIMSIFDDSIFDDSDTGPSRSTIPASSGESRYRHILRHRDSPMDSVRKCKTALDTLNSTLKGVHGKSYFNLADKSDIEARAKEVCDAADVLQRHLERQDGEKQDLEAKLAEAQKMIERLQKDQIPWVEIASHTQTTSKVGLETGIKHASSASSRTAYDSDKASASTKKNSPIKENVKRPPALPEFKHLFTIKNALAAESALNDKKEALMRREIAMYEKNTRLNRLLEKSLNQRMSTESQKKRLRAKEKKLVKEAERVKVEAEKVKALEKNKVSLQGAIENLTEAQFEKDKEIEKRGMEIDLQVEKGVDLQRTLNQRNQELESVKAAMEQKIIDTDVLWRRTADLQRELNNGRPKKKVKIDIE